MTKTVIGLYRNFETARTVVQELTQAGIPRENISLVAHDADERYAHELETTGQGKDVSAGEGAGIGAIAGAVVGLGAMLIPGVGPVIAAGPLVAALTGAGVGAVAGAATGGIAAGLIQMGVPESDANLYSEGIRQGGTLVSVIAEDALAGQARDIMRRHDPLDLDQRQDMGLSQGSAEMRTDAQSAIPVVEEQLEVGKREVERGGVRVSTHVSEQPVQEQIELREEQVHVERRPTDRPASEADINQAFREETFEVTERAEKPVVSKEARVVEEVVVNKDVNRRVETVEDTVRRTDVKVERTGEGVASEAAATDDYAAYEPQFRTHYGSNFARTGRAYEHYVPAYRYGYSLARHNRYRDYDWTQVEPEARHYWEERNPGTWERFKDAVRESWDRVRGRG